MSSAVGFAAVSYGEDQDGLAEFVKANAAAAGAGGDGTWANRLPEAPDAAKHMYTEYLSHCWSGGVGAGGQRRTNRGKLLTAR